MIKTKYEFSRKANQSIDLTIWGLKRRDDFDVLTFTIFGEIFDLHTHIWDVVYTLKKAWANNGKQKFQIKKINKNIYPEK